MLVNAGFDFDAVMSLFLRYPCAGKFAERNARDPEKAISQYLFPTFASAQRKAEGRIVASSAIEWAQARVWSGRTGAIDRAVYLAHCQLAQQCGRIEYGASCRQLGEVAQVDRKTATSATNRLIDAGLLASVKRSDRYTERASVYRLGVLHNSPFPTGLENGELCNKPHDAFRARGFGKMFKARGLGKAAGLVFAELQRGEPLNVKELTERTGRDRSTVWRVLNRMARIVDNSTGEIVAMVKRDDAGKWHAVDGVDLDAIARMLGTFGGNEWQHAQHERERREHRERLNNQNDSNRDAYRTGQNRTREDDNLCQKMTRAD